jgi:sugar-specific transcriptional regulator TrmB
MKIKQVLTELGLTDTEADIYLQLIKTSGVHPASIIAQKLKMNRTTVYKTLLKLAKMGLVTKTMKHGIICFFAEEPDKNIDTLLGKRKTQLNFITDLFLESIPEIQNLQREDLYTPKVRYYEGIEGVKRVYEDTLIDKETIYAIENVEDMSIDVQDYLWNDYVPRRTEKEIFAYVITPNNPHNEDFRSKDSEFYRETRFIAPDQFPIEIEMNIYGKKIAFFSYKEREMFGVIIESASIANSMKAMFNLCWELGE